MHNGIFPNVHLVQRLHLGMLVLPKVETLPFVVWWSENDICIAKSTETKDNTGNILYS